MARPLGGYKAERTRVTDRHLVTVTHTAWSRKTSLRCGGTLQRRHTSQKCAGQQSGVEPAGAVPAPRGAIPGPLELMHIVL